MCSTPPASTRSWVPEAISAAAISTAVWAEPQRRSSTVAGTSNGYPAWSQALRATLRDCSPNGAVQPTTRSSTTSGATPADSSSAMYTAPSIAFGWTSRNHPRSLGCAQPIGVRSASTIQASRPDPAKTTQITVPPSTGSTWPVMYDAASEAKKTNVAAISSGSAQRPSGMRAMVFAASFSLLRMFSVIAVAASGATALTVTWRLASSLASDLVMPMIADLAAA